MTTQSNGNFSRRKFIKTSVAASAAAVGPWVINAKTLASSGEVNILMWSDYLPEDFLAQFKSETGIAINYTGIGSNEEIINKMKATKGKGFDICSPTNVRSGQWIELDLLQPWDYDRIPNIKNANPAMLSIGTGEWNFGDAGSHWLPHIWGTEAISWRTDLYSPAGGEPSYGNIWDGSAEGNTMIRPPFRNAGRGSLHGDNWRARTR